MLDGTNIADWRQPHGARLTPAADGWLLSDGDVYGFQVVELHEPLLARRAVRLSAELTPAPGARSSFCVHHKNNLDVAVVGRDGRLLHGDELLLIDFRCEAGADGRLLIEVVFWNEAPMLAVGVAAPSSVHRGSGATQFVVHRIQAAPASERYEPAADQPLVLVDVGAREGLDEAWAPHLPGLQLVMFEPEETEAARIRETLGPGRHVVMDTALADKDGGAELFLTRAIGCSSLLEPDPARLKGYRVAPWFEVTGRTSTRCRRYDSLHAEGRVPAPDVIKIDVQGLEYEVLSGFGDLLQSAVAIELEAHFYPFYKGQKLIGDITTLLDQHGFALRNIVPQGYQRFNNELAEMNAFFTTRRKEARAKAAFVEEVWSRSNPR